MRSIAKSSLIATACLTLGSNALPRPQATYSVVNVDGGSQPPDSLPTTVFQTITSEAEATTVSVTNIVSPTPATVVTTAYGKATETALIPQVSPLPDNPRDKGKGKGKKHGDKKGKHDGQKDDEPKKPHHAHPVPAEESSPTPEVMTVVSVVTATATPTATSYYDDGMWHTSYAMKTMYGHWTPSSSSAPGGNAAYAAATGVAATGSPAASSPVAFNMKKHCNPRMSIRR